MDLNEYFDPTIDFGIKVRFQYRMYCSTDYQLVMEFGQQLGNKKSAKKSNKLTTN